MKKDKLLLIIFIAIIITLLFNCKYILIDSENIVYLWLENQISLHYTFFSFFSRYFDTSYCVAVLWDILILIFSISILISLFLCKYISKILYIKLPEEIKIEDKIFLIIFSLLLILPISRFDNKSRSLIENRGLAKRPKILKNNVSFKQTNNFIFSNLNWNYLKDLDKYINDRFFMRNLLIYMHKDIVYNTAIRYPQINKRRYIDKKDKWIGRYYLPPIYKNNLSAEEYNDLITNIKKGLIDFQKYCKDNNTKLFVVIHPEKASIYKPYPLRKNNDKDVKEFVNEINPKKQINIIFPIDELQTQAGKSDTLLYYKTDHHLTNDGYYIVYKLLMQEIKKSFPKIRIANKSEYKIGRDNYVKPGDSSTFSQGSQCEYLTIQSCNYHLDYLYNYYIHRNNSQLKEKYMRHHNLLLQKFQYPNANAQKVLMIGNSHVEGFSKFIAYSFKDVYKLRLNGPSSIKEKEQYKILKYYEQIMEEIKPDIIILVIDYDAIKELGKIAKYD